MMNNNMLVAALLLTVSMQFEPRAPEFVTHPDLLDVYLLFNILVTTVM